MQRSVYLSLCYLLAAAVPSAVANENPAAEKPGADAPISYFRDIRPIFQASCQGCHQPAKAEGAYVMTKFDSLVKGGESEQTAVEPGKPEESYLLDLVTPVDGKAEMPKEKDPLTAEQIEKIRKWIAAGAKDDTPASVSKQFDAAHPPVYEALPVLTSIDFSPDDSLLALSGYHEVLLIKADSADASGIVARLVGQSERIESVTFSPDGKLLAVSGGSPGRLGELQVWDVDTKKLKYTVPVGYDTLYGASWSHDGTKIAFGCADNTVRVIEASSGKQILFQGAHSDWVLDTVFSKDSSHLVSVSRDRSMKLIEVATQRFVDNITSITPGALKGGLMAVDRHPQKDELLIGGADGTPKVYKMFRTQARQIGDDFNLVKAYEAAPGRICDAKFNADGSRFVVGSSLDGTGEVRVYETDSGKLLFKAEGQHGGVYGVAFSTSGKLVASCGFDGLVRITDAETGKLVREFVPVPIAGQSPTAAK